MLFDLQIFSGSVYPPSETTHAQSLFRFPIVFGINVLSGSCHLVTPFDLHTFLRLPRALCRPLVVEGSVVRS